MNPSRYFNNKNWQQSGRRRRNHQQPHRQDNNSRPRPHYNNYSRSPNMAQQYHGPPHHHYDNLPYQAQQSYPHYPHQQYHGSPHHHHNNQQYQAQQSYPHYQYQQAPNNHYNYQSTQSTQSGLTSSLHHPRWNPLYTPPAGLPSCALSPRLEAQLKSPTELWCDNPNASPVASIVSLTPSPPPPPTSSRQPAQLRRQPTLLRTRGSEFVNMDPEATGTVISTVNLIVHI